MRRIPALLLILFLNPILGVAQKSLNTRQIPWNAHLKFLGQCILPYNMNFRGTIVGGLSGIDYNPQKNEYYLISDDRSLKNPARFYTAKIYLGPHSIDSVALIGVTFLKNRQHKTYPNSSEDPSHTPDPEALRFDHFRNRMIWSSEGERIVRPGKVVLEDPAITEITPSGNYLDTFELPSQLRMQPGHTGPRRNKLPRSKLPGYLTLTSDSKYNT